jgi:Zn-dependent metalloprotease/DNA/RNA endonuclease G (NUC1)
MSASGLRPFSFHRHDRPAVAETLRPMVPVGAAAAPGRTALASLDAESAARRYLAEAFASDQLPTFTPTEVDGQASEFRTLGAEAVPLTGTTTVKFRQQSRRVPVYGSLVTVELDEGNELLSINSSLGEPTGVSPVATIAPAQVLQVIAQHGGDVDGPPEVVPRLHFYFEPGDRTWHLAYIAENVFHREASDGSTPVLFDFVVDAHTGALLAQLPRTQSLDPLSPHPATRERRPVREDLPPVAKPPLGTAEAPPEAAADELGNQREFRCQPMGDEKRMVDETHNVHTHDFEFRDLGRDGLELPGRYVSIPPGPWARAGVSAHANAVEVARFLREVLKRDGLDNRGGRIISSINCCVAGEGRGREWRNAAWMGTQMVYGQRRTGERLVSYAAALDVVAHEFLHGLTDHTARLEYAAMSGALNESYSDIFGIMVSNLAQPDLGRWNWQMGEELDDTGVPIRDLRSPGRHGQPEHMRDYRDLPVNRPNDWGGVHTNSGIHNRAAYVLLTSPAPEGGYLFEPRSVAALFYIALTQQLSRTSGFADSRRGVELAARSLFRNDPGLEEKLEAVARAFESVGILAEQPEPVVRAEGSGLAAPSVQAGAVAGGSVSPTLVVPYDPDFLGGGFRVPLPMLSDRARRAALAGGDVLDYTHFSLVMHEQRRTALFTACNIDAAHQVRLGRTGLPWMYDSRLPTELQLGPAYYAGNAWDRGHLVRRQDPIWGPVRVAREANAATFYFTNAAPQHENFNQDEWLVLEDWVLEHATDFAYRLCVFTGPVLRADDPPLRDAQVPAGFWKIVVLRDATADGDDLSVVAFFMKQTEMLHDKLGKELLQLKSYQVTVSAIEEWTGLDFGELKDADELAWALARLRAVDPQTVVGFQQIGGRQDLVFSGDRRRAVGGRIHPRPDGQTFRVPRGLAH